MQSIRESVHQLLEDQISRLGMQAHYTVQKAEILGRNGTSFTFHGLRDQSVRPSALHGTAQVIDSFFWSGASGSTLPIQISLA